MADILVTSPFQPLTLPTQFKAVFNGYIYCGTVDAVDPSVSQVQVYLVNEAGNKVPVAQPLRTNAGGYLVYNGQPAKFVTDSNHSLLVQDSFQVQVWYEPNMAAIDPDALLGAIAGPDGAGFVGAASYAQIRAYTGSATKIDCFGVVNVFDGGNGMFYLDATDLVTVDNGGTVLVDAAGRRWKRQYEGPLDALWFGAVGDGVADNTAAFASLITAAIAGKGEVSIPSGDYKYSSLPNIKTPNFRFIGAGSTKTILRYTGTGTALSLDAFISGGASDPFCDGMVVGGFSIIGATMTRGMFAQGISRHHLFDIKANGSSGADGTVAFQLAGCMLGKFSRLMSSYVHGAVPYRGFLITAGTRAAASVGASSNNIFESLYPEQNSIGIQLASNGADQNVFIGGAPEACLVYGLLVGINCRYNTFIGVGAENTLASNQDVNDSGIYSRYINCYSSKSFIVGSTSKGISIDGSYFERLEIQSGAEGATVNDVTVNNWASGAGGFFNNGTGTRWRNVFDADLGAYIYKNKARFAVTVGASPAIITNDEGIPVKVRVYNGTVTQVLLDRGGDTWAEPNPTASAGGTTTTGIYLLMPGDKLSVSFSVAPNVNVIPLAGF